MGTICQMRPARLRSLRLVDIGRRLVDYSVSRLLNEVMAFAEAKSGSMCCAHRGPSTANKKQSVLTWLYRPLEPAAADPKFKSVYPEVETNVPSTWAQPFGVMGRDPVI
ncbi:hypothetical protein Bbelb_047350 [Branchiostoma belcheri]|nr:hypothetical protein Bbelb_047350 [Branchiostoma belcheri]